MESYPCASSCSAYSDCVCFLMFVFILCVLSSYDYYVPSLSSYVSSSASSSLVSFVWYVCSSHDSYY